MSNSRKHIQLYRNPSAVTMSDGTELFMGEPGLGTKPCHEKIFIKNAQGNITTLSSEFAKVSLRESAGVEYNHATDTYNFRTPYSDVTNMSDFLDEAATKLNSVLPSVNSNFKVEIRDGQPLMSYNIDAIVNTVIISKRENGTLTPVYSGYGQTYIGNTTVGGVEEEYVIHYVLNNAPNIVIEESYYVYLYGIASTSASTFDGNTNAQITFYTSTDNVVNANITTGNGEYIWLLTPSVINLKKASNQNFKVSLDEENVGTLTLSNGLFNCYRTLQKLIECDLNIKMEFSGLKKGNKAIISPNVLSNDYQNFLLEDDFAYGVQYDKTVASPDCTRIGNMKLHASLPVQSQMKGCLLDDDGNVIKYLNPNTWVNEPVDGSMGQVMVEIPEFWWKFSESGNTQTVMLSHVPVEGYRRVGKNYIAAYEATVDRGSDASGGTEHTNEWKLVSIQNSSPRYRGGNNNASGDTTYANLLGKPASHVSLNNFRTYARRRNSKNTCEWNAYTYLQHKIITWFFVVEYATRHTQKDINTTLTAEGYKQGGLGKGVSKANYNTWGAFNGRYPFVPIGQTNSLGNGTGEVGYQSYSAEGETWVEEVKVVKYRGLENPFGNMHKWVDGVKVVVGDEATGESRVYVSYDPKVWNGLDNTIAYKYIGNEARNSASTKPSQEILFGEEGDTISKVEGTSYSEFWPDGHYSSIPDTTAYRGLLVGGSSKDDGSAGLVYSATHSRPSESSTYYGSRLSFIPGPHISEIREVEYLENDGNQYINTNVFPNAETGIYIKVAIKDGTDRYMIGVRNDASGDCRWCLGHNSLGYYYGYGQYNYFSYNSSLNNPVDLYLNYFNNKKAQADGLEVVDLPTLDFNPITDIRLFGSSGTAQTYTKFNGRLYRAIITQGDKIVRDYIPVRVGTVGYMYDRVGNKLYGNEGSGSFTFGNDIE